MVIFLVEDQDYLDETMLLGVSMPKLISLFPFPARLEGTQAREISYNCEHSADSRALT